MSMGTEQKRLVKLVGMLILWAYDHGYEMTFGDAWAKEGHMKNSLHYDRLAIDLNLFKDGVYLTSTEEYAPLGEYFESIGGTWGGRFQDGNHFSVAFGGRK